MASDFLCVFAVSLANAATVHGWSAHLRAGYDEILIERHFASSNSDITISINCDRDVKYPSITFSYSTPRFQTMEAEGVKMAINRGVIVQQVQVDGEDYHQLFQLEASGTKDKVYIGFTALLASDFGVALRTGDQLTLNYHHQSEPYFSVRSVSLRGLNAAIANTKGCDIAL